MDVGQVGSRQSGSLQTLLGGAAEDAEVVEVDDVELEVAEEEEVEELLVDEAAAVDMGRRPAACRNGFEAAAAAIAAAAAGDENREGGKAPGNMLRMSPSPPAPPR